MGSCTPPQVGGGCGSGGRTIGMGGRDPEVQVSQTLKEGCSIAVPRGKSVLIAISFAFAR